MGHVGKFLVIAALFLSVPAFAENEPCASALRPVTRDWVKAQLERNRKVDPAVAQMRTVLQRKGYYEAFLNQDIVREAAAITDWTNWLAWGRAVRQGSSGRCWLEAMQNGIRSIAIQDGKLKQSDAFSGAYPYFYSMLEKGNLASQALIAYLIEHPGAQLDDREVRAMAAKKIEDEGETQFALYLLAKYGMVLEEQMPDTFTAQHSKILEEEATEVQGVTNAEILKELHGPAEGRLERMQAAAERGQAKLFDILASHLNVPPDPEVGLALAKKIGFNAEDYVLVSGNPRYPTGKAYEVRYASIGVPSPGIVSPHFRALNLPRERMEELIVDSIDGGFPAWFSAEVKRGVDEDNAIMNQDLYRREAAYGFELEELPPELRLYLRLSRTAHMMVFNGYLRPDENGPVTVYRAENTWKENIYKVFRNWMPNVFEIAIHKKFLTPEELKVWEGEAVQIRRYSDYY